MSFAVFMLMKRDSIPRFLSRYRRRGREAFSKKYDGFLGQFANNAYICIAILPILITLFARLTENRWCLLNETALILSKIGGKSSPVYNIKTYKTDILYSQISKLRKAEDALWSRLCPCGITTHKSEAAPSAISASGLIVVHPSGDSAADCPHR